MKRYHSGDSPGRWKRIIGPVEDSDSSSSDLDDLLERISRNYHRYNRWPIVDQLNPGNELPQLSNSQLTMRGMEAETSARPGPSGITSTSRLGDESLFEEDVTSISFLASTSVGLSRRRSTYDLVSAIRAQQNSSNELLDGLDRTRAIRSSPTPSNESETERLTKELNLLHNRLLANIECPVCLEPIVPPIHQCRRGHLVCLRCKSQLHQCPTCRDKMSDMRNWAVERLAEHLRYPCKNSSSGCPVTVLLAHKSPHEATCSFRTYTCLFRTCSWAGFRPLILSHLREAHASRFLEGTQQCIDVELNSPTLFYTDWAVSCLGQIFRINVFQNIPNSIFYSSIYLIGSSDASSTDFSYTITVNGPNCRRIAYTRQTHSESSKMSSLCASGDCLQIKGDSVKFFVNDDNKLRLHVELQRCPALLPSS